MKPTSLLPDRLRSALRFLRSRKEREDRINEFRRRRSGEPELPAGPIRRILFVCQGNICRSPFAERHLAASRGDLEVRSAGLKTKNGEPAQPGAKRVGLELGMDLSAHASHRLVAQDIEWADLIVAMQGWHLGALRRHYPGADLKVRLLGDYLPGAPHMIEDPWGQSDEVFRSVFERIIRANERMSELLTAGEDS